LKCKYFDFYLSLKTNSLQAPKFFREGNYLGKKRGMKQYEYASGVGHPAPSTKTKLAPFNV
jgi:hypothetical protein